MSARSTTASVEETNPPAPNPPAPEAQAPATPATAGAPEEMAAPAQVTMSKEQFDALMGRIDSLESAKTETVTTIEVTKPTDIPAQKGVTVNQWRTVPDGTGDAKQVDKREQYYEASVFDRMLDEDDKGRNAFENLGMGFDIIEDTRTK